MGRSRRTVGRDAVSNRSRPASPAVERLTATQSARTSCARVGGLDVGAVRVASTYDAPSRG